MADGGRPEENRAIFCHSWVFKIFCGVWTKFPISPLCRMMFALQLRQIHVTILTNPTIQFNIIKERLHNLSIFTCQVFIVKVSTLVRDYSDILTRQGIGIGIGLGRDKNHLVQLRYFKLGRRDISLCRYEILICCIVCKCTKMGSFAIRSKFILISLEWMPRVGCVRNKTEIAYAGVSRPTSTVVWDTQGLSSD